MGRQADFTPTELSILPERLRICRFVLKTHMYFNSRYKNIHIPSYFVSVSNECINMIEFFPPQITRPGYVVINEWIFLIRSM